MGAHYDFVPVYIDVTLAKRNWLSQDIETSANQVDKEYFVVLYQAKDAFIEVSCFLGTKSDDNSLWRVGFYSSFSNWERKQIVLVGKELEAGWEIARVDDVQKTVRGLLNLNLAKVYRLRG